MSVTFKLDPSIPDPGRWMGLNSRDKENTYIHLYTQYERLFQQASDLQGSTSQENQELNGALQGLSQEMRSLEAAYYNLEKENKALKSQLAEIGQASGEGNSSEDDSSSQETTSQSNIDIDTISAVFSNASEVLIRGQQIEAALVRAKDLASSWVNTIALSAAHSVAVHSLESDATTEVQAIAEAAAEKQTELLENIGDAPTDLTDLSTGTGLLTETASLLVAAQALISDIAIATEVSASENLVTQAETLAGEFDTQVSPLLTDLEAMVTQSEALAAIALANTATTDTATTDAATTDTAISDLLAEEDNWNVVSALFGFESISLETTDTTDTADGLAEEVINSS